MNKSRKQVKNNHVQFHQKKDPHSACEWIQTSICNTGAVGGGDGKRHGYEPWQTITPWVPRSQTLKRESKRDWAKQKMWGERKGLEVRCFIGRRERHPYGLWWVLCLASYFVLSLENFVHREGCKGSKAGLFVPGSPTASNSRFPGQITLVTSAVLLPQRSSFFDTIYCSTDQVNCSRPKKDNPNLQRLSY